MLHPLSFDKQKEIIINLADKMSRNDLITLILSHIQKKDTEEFRIRGTEEIIRMTNPCHVIPHIYNEYHQIVHDGISFLLSNISFPRFVSLAVDQLLMKSDISSEERLIELARQIPTLHKLGQIIARNRNIDKSFRKWLICLENDIHLTGIHSLKDKIESELSSLIKLFSIKTGDKILAEASVGAVIPFTWRDPGTDKESKGVFKLLKHKVKTYLKEESELLDKLAIFFDKNRDKYSLKNFRFIEIFQDIKEGLQRETDLSGEQSNLKRTAKFYEKNKTAIIPVLLPFSTENMTAMEYMNGGKITDADIKPENKKRLAKMLFKALIWHPLFSFNEQTLFHGDPHAGNIYAYEDIKDEVKLILLDWSQAGGLSKKERMNIFIIATGIFLDDEKLICKGINSLCEVQVRDLNQRDGSSRRLEPTRLEPTSRIIKIIRDILKSPQYIRRKTVEKIFFFIDQSAIQGIRFPKDLLLLRKAFFTLEGLIYELDPEFDMDKYVFNLLEELFIEELPKRWLYFFFPQSDSFNHYKSLMSNQDVQILANRIFMKCLEKGINLLTGCQLSYKKLGGLKLLGF